MNRSNNVTLYGTLIKDDIIKTNAKGNEYALFTLSVPQGKGNWCDYVNCIAFGEQASFVKKNPYKDTSYHVHGRIHTSSYEKNGKKQYTMDIVVEMVELVNKQ